MFLITPYQQTELVFSLIFFVFFYYFYRYFTEKPIIIWDIIWCTLTLFIALLLRDFSLNYNLLQSQNISPINI